MGRGGGGGGGMYERPRSCFQFHLDFSYLLVERAKKYVKTTALCEKSRGFFLLALLMETRQFSEGGYGAAQTPKQHSINS